MTFRMGFVLVFFLVIYIAYQATRLWMRFANKYALHDKPNERKIHTRPITTMGGVPIFCVYWLSVLGLTLVFRLIVREQVPIFIASTIVFLTGVLDDMYDMTPVQKSLGIVAASTIVYWFTDFKIYSIFEELLGQGYVAEATGYIVTVIWIYYITNAFNLIDGLDGLSTGVSIISLVALAFISYFYSPVSVFILTTMVLLLVATLLGFLPHNFHPARIFIGDTGILFVGFMISVFCLMGMQRPGPIALITPLFIIGVPLLDATMAIVRRLIKKQSIVQADRSHIHHRFLKLGLPHVQTVLAIYTTSVVFCIIALLLSSVTDGSEVYIIVGISIIGLVLFVDYINLLDLDKPLFFKHKKHK